jgi:outer membrane receptor protein involved in Fe transport
LQQEIKMKHLLTLLLITFSVVTKINAQTAKLSGKIIGENNKPINAASITVVGQKGGTTSNLDGQFTLVLSIGKKYVIEITAIGFATKRISEVEVKSNESNDINIVLEAKANDLKDVVVKTTSAKKETTNALISYQKNTYSVSQVISAEAIKRSPDRNTGEILKRVPGTSIQEGKYLVVRGLSDRYNQAMLNGIQLSSTEPDRKTFSFDLFPAPMIDNIIMNKAFLPELSGEWAGGLVQVNTKEIPSQNFTSIQIGTGFNTAVIGNPFYTYAGGKLDFLGVDDGTRTLPTVVPNKSTFASLSTAQQTEIGKQFSNNWQATPTSTPLNTSFQFSHGFNGNLFGKKVGGVLAATYNRSNKNVAFDNRLIANNAGDVEILYNNRRYSSDVLAGLMGNFSIQFNNNNRISVKNIFNINSSNFVIDRYDGRDFILGPTNGDRVKAQEFGLKQNMFLNTQIIGEHNLPNRSLKIKWYGSFNILDQYIPNQRRLFYTQDENNPTAPFIALLGSGAGQKSGSIFYGFLNDYVYNAGGDITKTYNWLGGKQTIKAGYLFQVKDRLFDCRPFFLNTNSNAIRTLSPDKIFDASNFGTGNDKVQFGELSGKPFRYIANTILNAAYFQSENWFTRQWQLVWGVRMEHFDQLVGSVVKTDDRHVNTVVNDFLPAINLTYKPSDKTNWRFAASQTVVRPEFRELSPFAFYDFELNAQVVGNKAAQRTKVTNLDLRYEIYPRAGELFTVGVFYKHFDKPIEYYFNRTGPATNTFNIANTKQATNYGIEVEFRKKLDVVEALKNFTVSGNFSYIYSRVKDTVALDRPLQGQSPYLFNIGINYDLEKAGLSTTLLFNQVGRRIFFVGSGDNAAGIPAIWEAPRPLLDLQIAKKIMQKKGEIRLSISDIINYKANFYHDIDGNGSYKKGTSDVLALSRVYGTTVSLTFGYTFR